MTDTDQSKPSSSAESTTPSSALASAQAGSKRRGKGVVIAVALLVVLALVLAGALYYQQRQYQHLRAALEQQHGENIRLAQDIQSQADDATALARRQSTQIQDMQNTLDNLGTQVKSLDQALQLVTDSGTDLLLLNDIDHLVTMAGQQLALGGNVANAIISLEAAQAQLARANRPSLAALQQSINGDLDQLRAVATINVPALSAQLDTLADLIARAPLLVPDQASMKAQAAGNGRDASQSTNQSSSASSAPDGGAETGAAAPEPRAGSSADWQAMLDHAWQWTQDTSDRIGRDFRSLFDVRRVDDAAALLMSPDQALRFREGLKQRAVTAQLALMMHQSKIWQSELQHIAQALDERYDMHAESSRKALKLARELHDTAIEISLPTVDNSEAAIAAAREAAEGESSTGPAADDGAQATDGHSASPDTGSGNTNGGEDAQSAASAPDHTDGASDENGAAPAEPSTGDSNAGAEESEPDAASAPAADSAGDSQS